MDENLAPPRQDMAMRAAAFAVIGIIGGATIGGFCGWAINARYWGVIQDPESFWAWGVIIGGVSLLFYLAILLWFILSASLS